MTNRPSIAECAALWNKDAMAARGERAIAVALVAGKAAAMAGHDRSSNPLPPGKARDAWDRVWVSHHEILAATKARQAQSDDPGQLGLDF